MGFEGGTLGCFAYCQLDTSGCTQAPPCGNGVLDPGEVCDDGMNMGGEGGCLTCTSIQECGDGMPEGTESCDDGILNGTGNGQCLDDCSATQSCGDIPAPQDGDFLLSASNIGLFDALFVQFYNQGDSLDPALAESVTAGL